MYRILVIAGGYQGIEARRKRLVLGDVAPLEALIDAESKVGRDLAPELLDVGAVQALGEAEGGVNDVGIETEEVLGDLGSASILRVQGSDEGGRMALGVDLVVDAAHRENGALKLGEVAGDLVVCRNLGVDEAVLEDETEVDLTIDESEELGGAGMDVRGVHTAGIEEADSGGDAEVGEDGEVLDVGGSGAATGTGSTGSVEVEDGELGGLLLGLDLAVIADKELLEAVNGRRGGLELDDELGIVDGRGWDERAGSTSHHPTVTMLVGLRKSRDDADSDGGKEELNDCGRHY